MLGVPQRIMVSDEEVEAQRKMRAQVQGQQAQAAAQMNMVQQAVKGAKTLSETKVTSNSALGQLLGLGG